MPVGMQAKNAGRIERIDFHYQRLPSDLPLQALAASLSRTDRQKIITTIIKSTNQVWFGIIL